MYVPVCGLPLIRHELPNGQIELRCRVCPHKELTNELAPPFWDDINEYENQPK